MSFEYNSKKIAIIGSGASGCICAYYLLKNGIGDITLFDKGNPLMTILPTGGGRCNLAHAEYDFKELVKNYPRGEKFLFSVFSKFATYETLELFRELGIETYTQDDGRIFPESNSAKDVKNKILNAIKLADFVKQEVKYINQLNNGYKIKTEKEEYYFTDVVLAIGGHSGLSILSNLDINIIPQKPSLVGLKTGEKLSILNGCSVQNVFCENFYGNILFTNFGVSGPLIYRISSIKAFDKFPYKLNFDLCKTLEDLQYYLNLSPHKNIKNVLSQFIPSRLSEYLLKNLDIEPEMKASSVDGKTRNKILNKVHNFEINITNTNIGEETVSAGGIDLDCINSKTMELKKYKNLYAIGEILNIDGFCGGFNLQNAWSTAYIAATSIVQKN